MEIVNQFASAHPFLFAGATAIGGFVVRHYLFTKETARRLVKAWFDFQRAKLKKAGRTQAEIKVIMKQEADFFLDIGQEAEIEADAEPAEDPKK